MAQDPYPSELPFPRRQADPRGGDAYRRGYADARDGRPYDAAPYQPGPYQPGPYYPPYRSLEGEKAAQLSLILGVVGLLVVGIVLGPFAIWQAKKAERLGVPATAGKVLGWITVVFYGVTALLFMILMILMFAFS